MTAPLTGQRAPSQTVQAKAAEYLLTGRVSLDFADRVAGVLVAAVQGSKPRPYAVTHSPRQGWGCTCQATCTCAHILACQAIWQPAARSARREPAA